MAKAYRHPRRVAPPLPPALRELKNRVQGVQGERPCWLCRKPFTPENNKARFCSDAHRTKFWKLKKSLGEEKLIDMLNQLEKKGELP